MRYRISILAGFAAAVVLAAGCGSTSSSSSTGTGAAAAATTVHTAHSSSLGADLLVNAKGMTLYTLSAERGGRLICTISSKIPGGSASCLSLWHPLTVAKGTTPTGAAQLGTITRPDNGVTQVTWHGRPLYTFTGDKAPGDASGNGFKDVGVWHPTALSGSVSGSGTAAGGYGSGGY